MQRTVNATVSSHNNMLVPEDEIVAERTAYKQEELLQKENQVLKVGHHQIRQPSERVITFQAEITRPDVQTRYKKT